jgi:hypothetical protein
MQPFLWKRFYTDEIDTYVGIRNEPVIDMRGGRPVLCICDGTTQGPIPLLEPPVTGIITPNIISPANGTNGIEVLPILTSSPFQCVDTRYDNVIHEYSRWQVATDSEFTELLLDTDWVVYLTVLDLQSYITTFNPGVTYYTRVKYISHYDTESNWSPTSSFTTKGQVPNGTYIGGFIANDGSKNDYLGFSIGISQAGDVVVVGAYGADEGQSNTGAMYVFKLEYGTWVQSSKVVPSNYGRDQYFGRVVGISGDGTTIITSTYNGNNEYVYIYTLENNSWVENNILTSETSSDTDFGYSLALNYDGTVAAIGERHDNVNGWNSGSVSIYRKVNGTWTLDTKLIGSVTNSNDRLGSAVSLSNDGNTLATGSYTGESPTNNSTAGLAYIFKYINGVWVEVAVLGATDAAGGDYFGFSLSISGDGKTLAVGAYRDDDRGSDSGSAYIFTEVNSVWEQTVKIKPSDLSGGDRFGLSVAISPNGDYVVAGSSRDDPNGSNSGSVYVFVNTAVGWVEQLKITPPDGKKSDYFGYAVAASATGNIAIGAYGNDDRGSASGSFYLFGN